jgi:F-type H+-transporting ATPase subunit epsilon
MPLTLEIVTPEARVYSDTIDTVVIPTVEGEVGILPGHIPLLTQVQSGELRVTKGGETLFLAVSGGFAEVQADRVSVLAERAITEEYGPSAVRAPSRTGAVFGRPAGG